MKYLVCHCNDVVGIRPGGSLVFCSTNYGLKEQNYISDVDYKLTLVQALYIKTTKNIIPSWARQNLLEIKVLE